MRCCGVESPESPSCPGSRLSCVRLLLLLSVGRVPLALSTSYLQNHCLWRCCLSDWMIPAEPFIHTNAPPHTHSQIIGCQLQYLAPLCVWCVRDLPGRVWSLYCLASHSCRLSYCKHMLLYFLLHPAISVKTNSAMFHVQLMTVFTAQG